MWFQRRREVVETDPAVDTTVTTAAPVYVDDPSPSLGIAYRINEILTFLYSLAAILIVCRFVLMAWTAGSGSGFADFVMRFSGPLVHPFDGLFTNPTINGMHTFDVASVVALIVWGVVTSIVCHLVTLLLAPVYTRRITAA